MQEELKRQIIKTGDGSTTIHLPDWNEQYHSKHGAINEARHVFIQNGFDYILQQRSYNPLKILEIGFGTGLNAFITFLEAEKRQQNIHYTGVEAYPVKNDEIELLNYPEELSVKEKQESFMQMHTSDWQSEEKISSVFSLTKRQQFFDEIKDQKAFDLVYFDAFGARVQPELWTVEIFKKMFAALNDNGVLVTYAAKGSVRRAMQEVGFTVERLPGPPGKREMLRALK
ncbi:MAG: SAM-dependent methyltransferase [Aquimarina sp.]|nr:SAM-dependent methyltransferase [Aquimarina sp.]